jgi:Fur family ferric uptake transcriptional regulator
VATSDRRRTHQRQAIERAFRRAGRPLSPQEVLAGAGRDCPGLGVATVYRTIRALSAEGWLRPVGLPGAASRYEVAGKEHHHHFHCRSCDRLYEVDDCPGRLGELAPPGFRPEAHEIILYGLCRTCVAEV